MESVLHPPLLPPYGSDLLPPMDRRPPLPLLPVPYTDQHLSRHRRNLTPMFLVSPSAAWRRRGHRSRLLLCPRVLSKSVPAIYGTGVFDAFPLLAIYIPLAICALVLLTYTTLSEVLRHMLVPSQQNNGSKKTQTFTHCLRHLLIVCSLDHPYPRKCLPAFGTTCVIAGSETSYVGVLQG